MNGQEHGPMSMRRRVVMIVLRVLAIVGGIGMCGWVALWLAFTV
ncbi:hypothetical protein [Amycolatopsis australiensis]|uniref:Uncharacterized protein n=1 Tax=Amycolatopsis australiensis TaxID=546364 RepID=A0A1K1RS25_9PSEU|nr:hypothetical protein [Amycolatopsis australiensis]SFW74881.1 hypothetical protein SAMN04489730_3843 [Amycolatopsis australiensis]